MGISFSRKREDFQLIIGWCSKRWNLLTLQDWTPRLGHWWFWKGAEGPSPSSRRPFLPHRWRLSRSLEEYPEVVGTFDLSWRNQCPATSVVASWDRLVLFRLPSLPRTELLLPFNIYLYSFPRTTSKTSIYTRNWRKRFNGLFSVLATTRKKKKISKNHTTKRRWVNANGSWVEDSSVASSWCYRLGCLPSDPLSPSVVRCASY